VGDGSRLVAGGDPAELLEAVNRPLDLVALPIGGPVEARVAALIAPGGGDRADAPSAQVGAHRPVAEAPVARHAPRPDSRAAPPSPVDLAAPHQHPDEARLVPLAAADGHHHGSATALRP